MERYTSPRPGLISRRRCYPSEVGYQKNLYRSPEADSANAQLLETDWFQRVDSDAAKALVKLNEENLRAVPPAEGHAWTLFILSLFHRTPAHLDALKQAGKRVLRNTLPNLERRLPDERDDVRRYVAEFNDDIAERTVLRNLPHIIANENIWAFLSSLYWMIMDVPEGCPDLLLSDDPLARTNGLKTEEGHIAMPLSPRRMLIGVWQAGFAEHLRRHPPLLLVKGMNESTVEGARHFAVAPDRRQERFIRNRFGKSPRSGLLDGRSRTDRRLAKPRKRGFLVEYQ